LPLYGDQQEASNEHMRFRRVLAPLIAKNRYFVGADRGRRLTKPAENVTMQRPETRRSRLQPRAAALFRQMTP
jgi:hypothetical protein